MPAASSCPAEDPVPLGWKSAGLLSAFRLSHTTGRTNVPKWGKRPTDVSKLLAKTQLSIYFFEENSFVAFTTLSHCSETEKPLTRANLPAYSGVGW
jgi:hypothetical protein